MDDPSTRTLVILASVPAISHTHTRGHIRPDIFAGFFDPGFGLVEGRARGSKAVLEVRSYGVPFTLEHGQIVGWLKYASIASGVAPAKLYGTGVRSNYQGQGLRLAKHFKPWQAAPSPQLDGDDGEARFLRPKLI